MAEAKIVDVVDALVAKIQTAWTAIGAGDSVSRVWIAPVSTQEFSSLTGRRVYLFPGNFDSGVENRSEDRWAFEIGLLMVERYTGATNPVPSAWVDERVAFFEQILLASCDYDMRTFLEIGSRKLWTESIEVELYDYLSLASDKIIWSEATIRLNELL